MPRSYSLALVSFFFFVSQVATASIDDIRNLWIASSLLGLAHGSVFSLFPTVCLEWFGMRAFPLSLSFQHAHTNFEHEAHFSENWGYLSLSPMAAGNLFSLVFGRNLDAHEASPSQLSVPEVSAEPRCGLGLECYVATIYLTIGATFFSILLSLWAGWRDWRKMRGVVGPGHGKPYWARGAGGRQRLVGEDSQEVL